MWKLPALQCLSPAPTKRLVWNWKQTWKEVTNCMKLNKSHQHIVIKMPLELQKCPTVFLMFSYYRYVTFLSLPISHPNLQYQPSVPQLGCDWAATSSASMALTWWDVGSPLVFKTNPIQEENIMGVNMMGAKLSPKPAEVYPAVHLAGVSSRGSDHKASRSRQIWASRNT